MAMLKLTNEEILCQAIRKAVKNGWKGGKKYIEEFKDTKEEKLIYIRPEIMVGIIFSRNFAECFWGKERLPKDVSLLFPERIKFVWQLHLQIMVLEKEPLKYLEKFL